ncbi:MAG: hypothetical protein U0U09_15870 [Cyclobacteriaceae bacterium]
MKKLLILFYFILSAVACYSQTLFDVLDPKRSNNSGLLSTNEKPVDGNPNLFEDFKSGKVFYGQQETAAPVNLDLYNNQLLITLEHVNYTVNPTRIKKVQIQVTADSVAEFKFINSVFMQTLYEDSAHAVYITHRVKIKKGTPGNGYQAATNDYFDRLWQYEMTKPYALTFADSKDLLRKLDKTGGVPKEKISELKKLKNADRDRIIFILKNL